MSTSEQVNELYTALAVAQGEFPAIPKNRQATIPGKDGRGGYRYAYADIADVLAVVLKVTAKHKLAVTQATTLDGGMLLIRTRLGHASGQWIESDYPVCNLNVDHQKMGGAMTYARRFALCSLLGVAADVDADGQHAAAPARPERNKPVAVKPEDDPFGFNDQKDAPPDDNYDDDASRLKYIEECKDRILSKVTTEAEIRHWWAGQAQARRDFGLNKLDVDLLKSLMAERFKPMKEAAQ